MFGFTNSPRVSEVEVNEVLRESELLILSRDVDEHLLMDNHLSRVIDRDLMVDLQVISAQVGRVGVIAHIHIDHMVALLLPPELVMDSHDNLVPVDVDVSLHQGHRLGKDIEASSDQVDEENLVVPHDAEHPLVVVRSRLRVELDDDPRLGPGFDRPLKLREGEHVRFVAEELESGWLVAVVDDVQQAVCSRLKLDFSEMNRLAGE